MEHIGKKLKNYRENRGLTQQQFASAVGIDRVTVSFIETGRVTPRGLTLAQIRRAFPDFEAAANGL